MTTIQNTASQSLLDSVNGTKTSTAGTIDAAQDRFMKLLVTQMKNQDPLNPLDNAQVTSQLAQLSTVTGIDKLNSTVESLMASMQSSQSLQTSNLIGHNVLVAGDQFSFDGASGYFGVELPADADNVNVTISDKAGNPLRTIALGSQKAGVIPLNWDGYSDAGALAASGTYQVSFTATSGGESAEANALTLAQVNSVSTSASGIKLNLSNATAVSTDALKQIF